MRGYEEAIRREVAKITQEMVRMSTVNDNEKTLAQWIKGKLDEYHIPGSIDPIIGNRANVIGKMEGMGERKALLLNGHLDTVPPGDLGWTVDPFSGVLKDGKVFGRGTTDMKGGLAAMIVAMKMVKENGLKLKGDLIFAGTAGEETDSIGAHQFVDEGGLDGVGEIIIGEPSACCVNIAEKGALWIEVTTIGKLAHGAFPDQGINAIDHMHRLLAHIYQLDLDHGEHGILGKPTMNVATIHGGDKTNTVPEKCVVTMDIRTIPGMEHENITGRIQSILEELSREIEDFQGELKITNDRPPVSTREEDEFVQLALQVNRDLFGRASVPGGVNFYTDASVFLPHREIPCILYGPGDSAMAHQINEYVEVESLYEAVRFYYEMIRRVLVD